MEPAVDGEAHKRPSTLSQWHLRQQVNDLANSYRLNIAMFLWLSQGVKMPAALLAINPPNPFVLVNQRKDCCASPFIEVKTQESVIGDVRATLGYRRLILQYDSSKQVGAFVNGDEQFG
ncbi:MAG: hypothetical protein HY679_04305 [Chloroflexi bacterium]|nr:hypothetical protein [Chloroflexota bacterium]